jgi:hypothetical protein
MTKIPERGSIVKVRIPGETPFAICVEERENSWMGCILNKLFREYSEFEKAQWLGREWGKGCVALPELHPYKKFDVLEFFASDTPIKGEQGWEPALCTGQEMLSSHKSPPSS